KLVPGVTVRVFEKRPSLRFTGEDEQPARVKNPPARFTWLREPVLSLSDRTRAVSPRDVLRGILAKSFACFAICEMINPALVHDRVICVSFDELSILHQADRAVPGESDFGPCLWLVGVRGRLGRLRFRVAIVFFSRARKRGPRQAIF